jgi:hypothetical protein
LPRSSACWPHPPHGTLVHRRCFWSETTGESIEKPNMLEKWLFFLGNPRTWRVSNRHLFTQLCISSNKSSNWWKSG